MDPAVRACAVGAALLAGLVVLSVDLIHVPATVVAAALLAVALVGAVVITVRLRRPGVDLGDLGVVLVGLSIATSPWNALSVGPIKPAPTALACGLVLLLVDALARRRPILVPSWIWALGTAIGLICITSLLWTPAAGYVAARYTGDLPDVTLDLGALGTTSAKAGAKWLVAAVALPVATCLAVVHRPRSVPAIALAWTIGAAVSATVAITDELGLTHVGGVLLPSISFVGRQAGLSIHPNHMSLAVAMAMPVLVWSLVHARGVARIAMVLVVPLMVGGLVVSGSRAGIAGAVMATSAALVVEPRTRRRVPLVAAIFLLGGLVLAAVRPQLIAAVGRHLRFVDAASADKSDAVRSGLGKQAVADFLQSPLHGIGFEVLAQGHDIYLELLAAGGLILLVGFLLAQFGFLTAAWRVADGGTGIGRALAVGAGTYLAVGVVSNQLADAFVHVPFALVAGLWAADHVRASAPALPAGPRNTIPEREEIPA